jgi:hypothetical protein
VGIFTLEPKDGGWHNQIIPKYIEWWYLDGQTFSNDHFSGSFALWGNLLRPESCVVRSDFTFTFSDGRVVDFSKKSNLADFHASTDRCRVQIGFDSLRDIGSRFLLHLEQDSNSILDIYLTPECSGFGYHHDFNSNVNEFFYWIVPVPKGTVTGQIQHLGQIHTFQGVGYHDHNWASVSLSEKIKSWLWGRYLADDITLIITEVVDDCETIFKGMIILERDISTLEYRYLKFGKKRPIVRIEETSTGWRLLVTDLTVRLEMDIMKNFLIVERGNAREYQRFLSQVSGILFIGDMEHALNNLFMHEFKNLSPIDGKKT